MSSTKQIVFDRKRKSETPIGWTQVPRKTKKGKRYVLWRCPHTHFNVFAQKTERCSYACRKDRTTIPHFLEYKIPPEEDDLFNEVYKEHSKDLTNEFFIQSLEDATAKFIGSTFVGCPEQLRSFICNIFQITKITIIIYILKYK